MATPWTDEERNSLRRLAAEGLSASQIAEQLDKTRNAVIGVCHRSDPPIRLRGRVPSASETPNTPRRPAKPRPAIAATRSRHAAPKPVYQPPIQPEFESEPLPEFEELFIPDAKRLSLLQLTEHTCKWPIGDPLHPDFHFCGLRSLAGKPYCEFHSRRAFQVAEPIILKGKKK